MARTSSICLGNFREGGHASTSFFERFDTCTHRSRREFDRRLNPVIRHAAAQRARHTFPDLRIRRIRSPVEQRLGRHDLPVLAEAALGNLLLDPGLLYRMKLAVLRESFKRRDLASARTKSA